jgi:hypothetical protein
MKSFKDFFCSGNLQRDNFLSRLFGIFNEEIVHYWCQCPSSPYENLGRPSVYVKGEKQGHTLDFTFRHIGTGKVFIAEMKCELSLDNYRYLILEDARQLEHHLGKTAFQKFLQAAREPKSLEVWVGGRSGGTKVEIDGAILILGTTTLKGREEVIEKYGLADVLSLEAMLNELLKNEPEEWLRRINQLCNWSTELFRFLSGWERIN